jgi:4-hydroxybenzoyl-CoA thioesterase
MIFRQSIRVEFAHCDPAGIVFYPRYFEMTNSVAESFFREVAGHSYAAMMAAGEGVPTLRLETTFHAPSRLEEVLDWQLAVTRLGTTSVAFRIIARGGDSPRLTADLTLVFVGRDGRPQPWPQPIRDRITAFMRDA